VVEAFLEVQTQAASVHRRRLAHRRRTRSVEVAPIHLAARRARAPIHSAARARLQPLAVARVRTHSEVPLADPQHQPLARHRRRAIHLEVAAPPLRLPPRRQIRLEVALRREDFPWVEAVRPLRVVANLLASLGARRRDDSIDAKAR
jgi:hypothetical protein